jgi:hypothetical protein
LPDSFSPGAKAFVPVLFTAVDSVEAYLKSQEDAKQVSAFAAKYLAEYERLVLANPTATSEEMHKEAAVLFYRLTEELHASLGLKGV